MDKICIIGHPSKLGGADTELDHQIRVWQELGLEVHIIHTGDIDANLKAMNMEERGCIIHPPRNWTKCKGMHVISYCNGEFLANIEVIKHFAKTTTFVGCMTWPFDNQISAHKRKALDWELFQTEHSHQMVGSKISEVDPDYKWAIVKPYFHTEEFPIIQRRIPNTFNFGRISRDDPGKFSQWQLWVYESMCSPMLKSGTILGWNDQVQSKVGNAPNWIKCFQCGEISAQELYKRCPFIIQASDTFENLPRVGFEAMASGSLLIVDDRGGWQQLVQHKQTGYLCKDQREFVYYSTRAAFEMKESQMMMKNAYDWLKTNWSMESAKAEWTRFFNMLENEKMD